MHYSRDMRSYYIIHTSICESVNLCKGSYIELRSVNSSECHHCTFRGVNKGRTYNAIKEQDIPRKIRRLNPLLHGQYPKVVEDNTTENILGRRALGIYENS